MFDYNLVTNSVQFIGKKLNVSNNKSNVNYNNNHSRRQVNKTGYSAFSLVDGFNGVPCENGIKRRYANEIG